MRADAPLTLDQFLALPEPEYDWLIPGLIERSDRLLLTGEEGHGKSTLLRQMALTPAAGLHPFTFAPITPITSLLVDAENSLRQMRRALIDMRTRVDDGSRLFVVSRPGGLDLTAKSDQQWLTGQIDGCQPGLIVIGPLYKLAEGDPNDEQTAKKVASYLDGIRDTYGCALLIEAHTPHAAQGNARPKRPYGASLWKRWPEFGIHIDQYGKLTHWRPGRDERDWPPGLQRGQTWPWEPTEAGEWMPTQIMEKLSKLLENDAGGLSTRAIRDAKLGRHGYVDEAVETLQKAGYIRITQAGPAKLHFSERPYRSGDSIEITAPTFDDLPDPL